MNTSTKAAASRPDSAGFSTIELVVVIVIVGILSAVATARFVGKGGFESRAYFDQAITVVRQAQKVAIAQRRNVIVVVTSDRIAACYDASCGSSDRVATMQNLNHSGQTAAGNCLNDTAWLCAGKPSGVAPITASAATIAFDPLGRAAAATTITISGSEPGDVTRNIKVEFETGYVHAS